MSLAKTAILVLAVAGLGLGCLFLYWVQNNDALQQQTHRQLREPERKQLTDRQWLAQDVFIDLLSPSTGAANDALLLLENNWRAEYEGLLVECWRIIGHPDRVSQFKSLLRKKTGIDQDWDINRWYQHIWEQQFQLHPDYAEFKATAHRRLDKSLAEYFEGNPTTDIRLDEVVWGGVKRDGIPPLVNPNMVAAADANYLDDSNVVFGIEINGDPRAYPQRILAHHEMFKDTVGNVSVNGVYCTLCGSMILYQTVVDEKHYELGTSGFLYRSNKLMYDEQTKSLWSTLEGKPVVGKLVGKGIQLKPLSVVTTTWGQWRKMHPGTTVLSLETGHTRNYDEGEAYKNYFATQELMFSVPELDDRLKNKDEILAIRLPAAAIEPLAIAANFLSAHPVLMTQLGGQTLVVLTDASGANRVYDTNGRVFISWSDDAALATEQGGKKWQVTEAALVADNGQQLIRVPAHRAFWFGWFAQYPNTKLIK